MHLFSKGLNKLMVPALSAGLLMGVAGMSQAQNFSFINTFNSNIFTAGPVATQSTLTLSNGASVGVIGTPTTIVLGNIAEFTVPGGGPNTFNSPYTAQLALTDMGTGQTLSQTFGGTLGGTADGGAAITGAGSSSAITNVFTSPSANPTLTFAFASGTYTVSNFLFLPPQPQTVLGGANAGAFAAFVNFTPAPVVPEPGSVALLVGMGVSGAGFLVRRRRSK